MMNTLQIRFQPGGRIVKAHSGISLLEAAARAGLIINTPCGGAGTCGKCRVRFLTAPPSPGAADQRAFSPDELAGGWRLACQTRIESDGEIDIPRTSVLGGYHQIQTDSQPGNDRKVAAAIHKHFLVLPKPTLEDGLPDLMRIERALRSDSPAEGSNHHALHAPVPVLQTLAKALRENRFSGTVTVRGQTLIHFEGGNTTDAAYGIAFDIGTTTLVGALLHLVSGEELAVVSSVNPQTAYGDDVLSRIAFASRDAAALEEIRDSVLAQLRTMAAQLCDAAQVSARNVYTVVCAGNTTMQHLLAGFNPASLGEVPFVPLFGRGLSLDGDAFSLGVHPLAQVTLFPVIGGFVGGDTVAGMLSTDLATLEGPVLMLDIGTNGEIVLVHDHKILAASTAAGPAFEGARISCGMRATEGAIEKVHIEDDLELGVIGGGPPKGLCGSGLIDLCGQLLHAGALQANGRLLTASELPEEIPEPVRRRLHLNTEGMPECVLYEDAERSITLTQQDIRELQLGAGAIRAGINILLKQAGLVPTDLKQVLIAGGFGSFIRRDNAQRIGLIPHELPHEKIRFVGNVAFSGAKWAVVSSHARDEADRLARVTQHVELSLDPDFAMEFAMAMQFPA